MTLQFGASLLTTLAKAKDRPKHCHYDRKLRSSHVYNTGHRSTMRQQTLRRKKSGKFRKGNKKFGH